MKTFPQFRPCRLLVSTACSAPNELNKLSNISLTIHFLDMTHEFFFWINIIINLKNVILFLKNSQNHFLGIICVQMVVLTNLTIILKNGVIIGKSVAGNVCVQNFVEFRLVVFEILMKMCFDFSISKAHSSVVKPKSIFFARAAPIIFGSSMPLRSLMQLFRSVYIYIYTL